MASTKPIAVAHLDFAGEWRGGQRQVFLLTTGLAAQGCPVHVITRPGTPLAEQLRHTPVHLHEMKILGEWDLFAARRLAKLVRENGVELVAAHASHPHGLAVMARRFGMDVPLVVHRRVDFPIGSGFFSSRKYSAPAAYIAISEAVKKCLLEGGVAEEKIHVVSSGVPAHQTVPEAKEMLALECGLDPQLPWVGNVAGLVEHKGQRDLLDAWSEVLEAGWRAELILIGDGPLRAELARQSTELGIHGHVHLLGHRNDLPTWFSAFDVFTMTSLTEGLCTSILDAMAARVPVVATAAGGIPELVHHQETGLLAPVGDVTAIAQALIETFENQAAALARAADAHHRIWQPRTVEQMVERTRNIYWMLRSENESNISK